MSPTCSIHLVRFRAGNVAAQPTMLAGDAGSPSSLRREWRGRRLDRERERCPWFLHLIGVDLSIFLGDHLRHSISESYKITGMENLEVYWFVFVINYENDVFLK